MLDGERVFQGWSRAAAAAENQQLPSDDLGGKIRNIGKVSMTKASLETKKEKGLIEPNPFQVPGDGNICQAFPVEKANFG